MTRHSKESALSPREFELLLEGARRIEKERQRTEAVFALFVMGRLGLRAGELIHMREDWIDWRNRRIVIPRQQDCHLGKDRSICGYCEQLAEQMVDVYDADNPDGMSRARERSISRNLERSWERGDELTIDDALELRWTAKTETASREVPFQHNPRVELAIERFFELPNRDGWAMSKSALNRRLNKSLRNADELTVSSTHPHGLRSTAATFLARKLDTLDLQSMMGWADMQTARRYIAKNTDATERALFSAF